MKIYLFADMIFHATLIAATVLRWVSAQTEGDVGYEDNEGYDYYDESVFAHGPTLDVPMVNVTVVVGQTAVLPCSITYLSKHKVIWLNQQLLPLTLEDRRVFDDSRFSVVRPSTKEWNLQIREVTTNDEGLYRCSINTNPVRSKVVTLYVTVPPTISDSGSISDVTVIEGESVELQCTAAGIPEPSIAWYKRHDDAEQKCRVGTSRSSSTGLMTSPPLSSRRPIARGNKLIITNVSRACHDVYECEAKNGVPPAARREITVTVEFPPQITMPASRLSQARGRETILECRITAFPQANNYWQKDGRRIQSSVRHRIDAYEEGNNQVTLSLRIIDIERSDYGKYQCVAANTLGRDEQNIQLFEYLPADGDRHIDTSLVPHPHRPPKLVTRVNGQQFPATPTSLLQRDLSIGAAVHSTHADNIRRDENSIEKFKNVRTAANRISADDRAVNSAVSLTGHGAMFQLVFGGISSVFCLVSTSADTNFSSTFYITISKIVQFILSICCCCSEC